MTLAIATILAYYACPTGDDFTRASCIRTRPWYGEVVHIYFHGWTGRWAGIGLEYLVLRHIDMMRWYPLLIGSYLLVQAPALNVFWRMLLGSSVRRRDTLTLTAATMALLWASSPSTGERYYWFCGGIEAHLNISLALLLIGGLVLTRWEELGRGRRSASIVGLAMFAFVITGLHELIALMLCLVLLTGTAVALKAGLSGPRIRAWLVVTITALVGLAVVAYAPGNYLRAAYESGRNPLHGRDHTLVTLQVAWAQVRQQLPSWILDVRLLAATLALVLSPVLVRAQTGRHRWGGISPRAIVTALWLLVFAGMFLVPSFLLLAPMPNQTLDAAYTLFVLAWITAVVVWTRSDAETERVTGGPRAAMGRRLARSAALGVFGLSMLVTGNTSNGIIALRDRVPQNWKRMHVRRDRLILEARRRGVSQIDVPIRDFARTYLGDRTRVYAFWDISEEPTWWYNHFLSWYYGVNSIRRVDPRATPGPRTEAVGLGPDGAARRGETIAVAARRRSVPRPGGAGLGPFCWSKTRPTRPNLAHLTAPWRQIKGSPPR